MSRHKTNRQCSQSRALRLKTSHAVTNSVMCSYQTLTPFSGLLTKLSTEMVLFCLSFSMGENVTFS